VNQVLKIPGKGKNIYFIIWLLMSADYSAFADAFPKSLKAPGGPILSLELPGSYETITSAKGSILFRGGIAALSSPFYLDGGHPSLPYLTFGYRIVLEKKKGKSNR